MLRSIGRRLAVVVILLAATGAAQARERWTPDQANAWREKVGWLVGCNFGPSNAINQLEMWQADTFDPATIDKELGYAESLGFNSVRVFLHHLLWEQDKDGFLERMDTFLKIADKHNIGVVFVPLDAVWDPFPKLGKQRSPKPHLHNSGWVQSPGAELLKDEAKHDTLKPYIQGIVGHFKNDRRVHAWDLFNEPDNVNRPAYVKHEPHDKPELARKLLDKVFKWAREMDPTQPLTSGVWIGTWGDHEKLSRMERLQIEESDVISFHSYAPLDELKKCVASLKRYKRPIMCTEYMARPRGSTFDPILGYLKSEGVDAYNWGFVAGKTQTIYPWDTWDRQYTAEPPVWFHDIFRPDGTPYDPKEVAYIRRITGKEASK